MSRLGALHLTQHTGQKHTGTVIFFHGSGSCGADIKEWVKIMVANFSFPHIKILYPTAPLQPYTPAGGQMRNVWFDRTDICPNVPENANSLAQIEKDVKYLIKIENDAGIPSNRIIIGGFSMGGALALYSAYKWDRKLAAAFAFSSFLNDNSSVYSEIKQAKETKLPPLLQIHGDIDDVVDLSWAKETFNLLKEHGVQGEFCIMERSGHTLTKRGVRLIKDWVEKHLPEI